MASILGFQYRGTYYYEASAYDQDWQERSPGTALLYSSLNDIFERDRPALFDLGAGYNEYKQVFGTKEERRGAIRVRHHHEGQANRRPSDLVRLGFQTEQGDAGQDRPSWMDKDENSERKMRQVKTSGFLKDSAMGIAKPAPRVATFYPSTVKIPIRISFAERGNETSLLYSKTPFSLTLTSH